MAATACNKLSHLRRGRITWRSLSTYLLPSSHQIPTNFPSSLRNLLFPPFQPVSLPHGCPWDKRINTVGFSYRLLCATPPSTSSTSSATVQDPAPNKSSTEDGCSDGGNKSEDSKQSGEAGKSVRGGPVSWLSFLLLALTGAGIIYYYDYEKKKHIEEIGNTSNAVKQGPSVGQAAIGGPFNLVNDQGKNVTEKDLLGKWTLIYFGFTHCPDICPDELMKMAAAVDKIKQKSGFEIVPVFISVDPERDTVEQVHEYVKEFHPKLIGLTGSPDEVRKAARAYRVYYMKTIEEGSDYLVDHSIVMYLMSPGMEFVKFYGKNHDVDSLADGVIKEIKQYRK